MPERVTQTGNKEIVILGAGISGLAAANSLNAVGQRPVVLEASSTAGGLTRTIKIDDFCFDYSGHLLHLAQFESPSHIPFAHFNDADWQKVERRSFCLIDTELITAPIQYNLAELEKKRRLDCIDSYHRRPLSPQGSTSTFRDFLIGGFGQYLSDLFLIPQNEKTWAISLDRISLSAIKRFFPKPDEGRILSGATKRKMKVLEYNSNFWYPKQGGIDLVVSGLCKGVDDIRFQEEVQHIDIKAHRIKTRKGHKFNWGTIISSIPIKRLCEIINDRELNELGRLLGHSSTILINIGLKAPVPKKLRNVHWVYIPAKDVPFYRVGIYSNLSKGVCPENYSAMYIEIGVPAEDSDGANVSPNIVSDSLGVLSNLGWIDLNSIACITCHKIPCAYVHFTPARELNLPRILDRLISFNIYPIGRYGLWEYLSMEDSILSGIKMVEELTGTNIVG